MPKRDNEVMQVVHAPEKISLCGAPKGKSADLRCDLGVLHDSDHEATDSKGRRHRWATGTRRAG